MFLAFSYFFYASSLQDGPNSALKYSLTGDTRLSIDRFGRIMTREPLLAGTILDLSIGVEDGGDPPLRADSTILRLTAVGTSTQKIAQLCKLTVYV